MGLTKVELEVENPIFEPEFRWMRGEIEHIEGTVHHRSKRSRCEAWRAIHGCSTSPSTSWLRAVVFDERLRPAKALKSAINTATQLEPAKWSYGNQSSDWWSSWQTSLG